MRRKTGDWGLKTGERGSSLVWTSLVMLLVVVPLVALLADGTRLYFVDVRLQNAADAACEDAAWSAIDRAIYRDTGELAFHPKSEIIATAVDTFNQVMQHDQAVMGLSANITIQPELAQMRVACSAIANMPLLFFSTSLTVQTISASKIRFQ